MTEATVTSTARVPTANGSKYLQQLCKHWSHNLDVQFTPDEGTIVFPRNSRGADWPADGRIGLNAQGDVLICTINASATEQLEALKGALGRHLDRFAFREAPLKFDWVDG